ncbi:MAG: hypothetical protein HC897_14595 [Thermoanaerobaculia bacterium]|nr:hypothetical protein [Thermoanaerobaculia bacterium]
MSRSKLLTHFVDLTGRDVVRIVEARDGWPGLVEIKTTSGLVLAAIHIGPIGHSHRDRSSVERRFQNPNQRHPVTAPLGTLPLLLGLWEENLRPVVLAMEITKHRLEARTRQSFFASLHLLQEAEAFGWAEQTSASGEHLLAFQPWLLPTFVEMRAAGVSVPGSQVASIVAASGINVEVALQHPPERARRAASVLVRSAVFSSRVVAAYDGLCAMCGLDFGLVEGAHIYPASASESPDEVWNGLALCKNHHAAFDRHKVCIDPGSHRLELHPEILSKTSHNDACQRFVDGTFSRLSAPVRPEFYPRPEMLERRYQHFEGLYAWAGR